VDPREHAQGIESLRSAELGARCAFRRACAAGTVLR